MSEKQPLLHANGQASSSSQGHAAAPITPKQAPKRKRDDGRVASFCAWIVAHQIGITVNLLLLLAMTHLSLPRARPHTRKFFTLSYYDEATGRYAIGWDDFSMVAFCITVFTGLRILIMDYIFFAVAEIGGITKPKEKTRFAEQAWVLMYYVGSFALGMYIMVNSNYWLDMRHMWVGWPDRQMDGVFKFYYLMQFAFWLQSIFVLNIEEHRKDHYQMLTHHLITSALIFTSYGYHHYRVGNVILCIMDTVDLVFPLAKMLKYMGYSTACDIAFGVFMVLWFVSRHVVYPMVLWSIFSDLPKQIVFGCYSGAPGKVQGPFQPSGFDYLLAPYLEQDGTVCHTQTMQWVFGGLLMFLQVLLLVWFSMIIRMAVRVLNGSGADDPRSDDESEDEMQDVHTETHLRVSPEELLRSQEQQAKARGRRESPPQQRSRRNHGAASGINLPSDRKELLGRIGCDKQD